MSAIAHSWRYWLQLLLDLGTAGYTAGERRRLNILNATAGLIVVSSSAYALSYALTDAHAYRWVIAINLALVVMAMLVPAAHRIHVVAGGLLIMASEIPALFALVAILGRDSGIQINLIVGAAVSYPSVSRSASASSTTSTARGGSGLGGAARAASAAASKPS